MNRYALFNMGVKASGLMPKFKTIEKGVNEPICTIDGKKYLLFSSNNYLSLTQDEEVKCGAIEAIKKYGVGPSGSRVVSGNIDITEKLESKIAQLVGKEACYLFPTGYMANVTIFQALMDEQFNGLPVKTEHSEIFSDEYNHGSIVDGCRLSKAQKTIFKHNDLKDLEQKLKSSRAKHRLIVTEGVFSLDGEIINIPEYIKLAKKYKSMLMIDDAHGVGILGKNGGGTPQLHNCAKDVDIIMGCCDKALGGMGGYLCASNSLITYFKMITRSSLLSSAYPTMMAGAMLKSVEKIQKGEDLRIKLFNNAKILRKMFIDAGFKVVGPDILPAIPVFIGNDKKSVKFFDELFKLEILCLPFRWPALPQNTSRLRVTTMINHKQKHFDQLIEACKKVGKKVGVI